MLNDVTGHPGPTRCTRRVEIGGLTSCRSPGTMSFTLACVPDHNFTAAAFCLRGGDEATAVRGEPEPRHVSGKTSEIAKLLQRRKLPETNFTGSITGRHCSSVRRNCYMVHRAAVSVKNFFGARLRVPEVDRPIQQTDCARFISRIRQRYDATDPVSLVSESRQNFLSRTEVHVGDVVTLSHDDGGLIRKSCDANGSWVTCRQSCRQTKHFAFGFQIPDCGDTGLNLRSANRHMLSVTRQDW